MNLPNTPNPYAPPTSELLIVKEQSVPSIHEALTRGYDFSIGDILNEAWGMTHGTKGLIIGGCLVLSAAVFVASMALLPLLAMLGWLDTTEGTVSLPGQLLSDLLTSAISYPFLAGIYLIGIRHADRQPIDFNLVFSQFGKFWPLLLTFILTSLMMTLGFMLLVLPGIYLSIAYLLAIPLVVERGLSPWEAMEASRKALTQHWFKVFGLYLLLGLIGIIATIPLGIGLIWALPLAVIATGLLYRTIFGVLPAAQ